MIPTFLSMGHCVCLFFISSFFQSVQVRKPCRAGQGHLHYVPQILVYYAVIFQSEQGVLSFLFKFLLQQVIVLLLSFQKCFWFYLFYGMFNWTIYLFRCFVLFSDNLPVCEKGALKFSQYHCVDVNLSC